MEEGWVKKLVGGIFDVFRKPSSWAMAGYDLHFTRDGFFCVGAKALEIKFASIASELMEY